MTIEKFAARYNQEYDWCHEIVDTTFFETRPYISELFGGWFGKYKITPETCDYSETKIFEEGVGTQNHNFELQIHSYKACHGAYFWIHPDLDKEAYKKSIVKDLVDELLKRKKELSDERAEIDSKLNEIKEFMDLVKPKKRATCGVTGHTKDLLDMIDFSPLLEKHNNDTVENLKGTMYDRYSWCPVVSGDELTEYLLDRYPSNLAIDIQEKTNAYQETYNEYTIKYKHGMAVEPIKPSEVFQSMPDFVIRGANECISEHYHELDNSSRFTQNELIEHILKYAPENISRQTLFDKHWLDIEPTYRRAGWEVEYDKPAYYEDYEANFIFSTSPSSKKIKQ